MKTTPIRKTALALALTAAFPALAQSNAAASTTLTPVIVTANGIPTRDSDATYASEVHDRAMIEASGAASLTDYLAKNTSLNVMPSSGNKNAPLLDMRGYGTESGYQSLVVVVDGYRLNNIDQVSAYLGGVPIDAIENIEISKGSGSVAFGDGAMSGVIQIRTRARNGVSVSAMTGSRGAQDINVSAGVSSEFVDLSANANNSKQARLSSPDVTGHLDGSDNRAERVDLTLKPVTGLKLFLGGGNVNADTRYVAALTPQQFAADPGQNGGNTYNHQHYRSSQWRAGAEYALTDRLTARYMHNSEDKDSEFLAPYVYRYNYNYTSDEVSLAYRSAAFDLTGGVQTFNGERRGTSNVTSKDNTSVYLQGVYRFDALSLSAGARRENVEYDYQPAAGTKLNGDHNLNAWDLGVNYRFSERWSVFANLNQAFQAPDIDRFFDGLGGFNGFIQPATSRNFTVGVNRDTAKHRLRVATFYSKLKNEIYYDTQLNFGTNTNIDKSHKYGLEISDRWQAFDNLSLYASYTYTRAIIDEENSGAGSLAGKDLPGVPRHGVNLSAMYQPWAGGTLTLTHAWRDSAYAISNFSNDNSLHRQSIYSSTSVSLRQRWKNIEGFVGVDNLFDRQNGMWVYATYTPEPVNVYPVDFRRTARVGVKVDLF
ncbi:MAG: TonB-dependent receptor [Rhodocyclaceae bacterium]|nr:TonB-dependent receptor [Rhodocyclaceae bacterium]